MVIRRVLIMMMMVIMIKSHPEGAEQKRINKKQKQKLLMLVIMMMMKMQMLMNGDVTAPLQIGQQLPSSVIWSASRQVNLGQSSSGTNVSHSTEPSLQPLL